MGGADRIPGWAESREATAPWHGAAAHTCGCVRFKDDIPVQEAPKENKEKGAPFKQLRPGHIVFCDDEDMGIPKAVEAEPVNFDEEAFAKEALAKSGPSS